MSAWGLAIAHRVDKVFWEGSGEVVIFRLNKRTISAKLLPFRILWFLKTFLGDGKVGKGSDKELVLVVVGKSVRGLQRRLYRVGKISYRLVFKTHFNICKHKSTGVYNVLTSPGRNAQ